MINIFGLRLKLRKIAKDKGKAVNNTLYFVATSSGIAYTYNIKNCSITNIGCDNTE